MRGLLSLAIVAGIPLSAVPASTRDLSTPSSRLVGRWQSKDPRSAAVQCRYFGPADQQARSGLAVTYRLENGEWRRIENAYRIVSERPNSALITIAVTHPTGSIIEQQTIPVEGIESRVFVRSAVELTEVVYRYIDDRNRSCAEENEHWSETLAAYAEALAVPRAASRPSSLMEQPQVITPTPLPPGREWSIVSIESRVTERNNSWWKFAWKLTLQNDSTRPHLFSGNIEFEDSDGFIVDRGYAYNMVVKSMSQEVFTGYTLITARVAGNVARTEAKVHMEK